MNEPWPQLKTLQPFLQEGWQKRNFQRPTPIQELVVPQVLEGKDIIAESPTGTGKTLAYLLPILSKVNVEIKNPQAVIMAPTRELIAQIQGEAEAWAGASGILSAALIGGADIKRQVEKLKQHPQIIVGTPARILELIKARKLKMHEVKTIVLDEADQMMDMNLAESISGVIKSTLRERQLLFFSATVSVKVTEWAKPLMKSQQVVRVNRDQMPAQQVEHRYYVCERREKADLLRHLVKEPGVKVLAFLNDAKFLDHLVQRLREKNVSAAALQGDATATEREHILKNFREGRTSVLLATDLAARGLDIENVTDVVHYDLPEKTTSFIHRSGRTGRMGAPGRVIAMITPPEESTLKKIYQELAITAVRKTGARRTTAKGPSSLNNPKKAGPVNTDKSAKASGAPKMKSPKKTNDPQRTNGPQRTKPSSTTKTAAKKKTY